MLRAVAILLGVAVFGASRAVLPLYAARPPVLLDGASLAWPTGVPAAVGRALGVFLLVWSAEVLLRRRRLALGWREAREESLRGYGPLAVLTAFGLLFLPGLWGVPMALWWLLLDASPWVLTLVAFAILSRKIELSPEASTFASLRRPWGTLVFGLGLLASLLLWAPERRFTQPYDERWGTGDEPRYVRIAASLLHDADADVSNAAEHVGERAALGSFLAGAGRWPLAAAVELWEAADAYLGDGRPGRATSLGGPVIEGRRGGTYYSFLPGLPLLLTPAMAIDAFVDPGRLVVTLFTCVLLGIVLVVALARLAEPYAGSVGLSHALATTLGLSLPVFFYHFQVYTEVTAAILLALVLAVVLDERSSLPRAALFGLACSYLPWLHGKYLPLWGVAALAFLWKERWSAKAAVGISLAGLGLLTSCLYAFHITGSLLPDSLWTLRGYERGATLFSPSTLPGLYHLFLSRDDGLFVYAPHYLLVFPAAVALYRRSRRAFWTGLALIAPYVLAAASHDQGGAGGWSPPARYFVPLVPVLALALAAWLEPTASRRPRLALLLAAASASFWTAQGMLDARNYPYDRPAFLASGFLDPTPVVGTSTLGFGLFVAIGVGLAATADRWASSFARATLGASMFFVVGGALVSAPAPAPAWVPARPPSAFRLRSTAPRFVQLPDCGTGTPRLAFRGTGGVHAVEVRGPGLEASIRVPSGTATELPVDVVAIRRWGRSGARGYRMLTVWLAEDERPVDVEAVCR